MMASKFNSKLKTCLVTGANRGIGLSLVQQLAATKQYNIIFTSRNLKSGQSICSSLESKYPTLFISCVELNVQSEASCASLAKFLTEQLKITKLNVLVNNAGYGIMGNDMKPEIANTTIQTNFFGVMHVTNHLMPFLLVRVNNFTFLQFLLVQKNNINQFFLECLT